MMLIMEGEQGRGLAGQPKTSKKANASKGRSKPNGHMSKKPSRWVSREARDGQVRCQWRSKERGGKETERNEHDEQ